MHDSSTATAASAVSSHHIIIIIVVALACVCFFFLLYHIDVKNALVFFVVFVSQAPRTYTLLDLLPGGVVRWSFRLGK